MAWLQWTNAPWSTEYLSYGFLNQRGFCHFCLTVMRCAWGLHGHDSLIGSRNGHELVSVRFFSVELVFTASTLSNFEPRMTLKNLLYKCSFRHLSACVLPKFRFQQCLDWHPFCLKGWSSFRQNHPEPSRVKHFTNNTGCQHVKVETLAASKWQNLYIHIYAYDMNYHELIYEHILTFQRVHPCMYIIEWYWLCIQSRFSLPSLPPICRALVTVNSHSAAAPGQIEWHHLERGGPACRLWTNLLSS